MTPDQITSEREKLKKLVAEWKADSEALTHLGLAGFVKDNYSDIAETLERTPDSLKDALNRLIKKANLSCDWRKLSKLINAEKEALAEKKAKDDPKPPAEPGKTGTDKQESEDPADPEQPT